MSGVFLYDGECRFCSSSARWLQRHAASTARVSAWQHADLAPLGLSADDCAEAVLWVEDGRRETGPDAVAAYLSASTGSWRTAGRVLAAPVAKRVTWPVYRWAADHRGRLPGGTPASELPRVPPSIKGVRRRRPRDLGPCARLLRVVYAEGQYPVHWPDAPRAWLDGEDVIDAWVAERQGEIIGHVAISRVGGDAVTELRWKELTGHRPAELAGVSRLFVRPRVRGQGVGTALLDVALGEIRARGLVPVLEVVGASRDAIRLYEERGWRLLAMYPWGEDLRIYYYGAPQAGVGS